MSKEVKVVFEPSGRNVFALPGTTVLEAAARAGFIIETPCGGAGTCGKCLVRITSGACTPVGSDEQTALGPHRIRDGYRLACQSKIEGNVTVEIPDTSLFQTGQKILQHDSGGKVDVKPRTIKQFIRLTQPDRDDNLSDMERLKKALGPVKLDISVIRSLPTVLRESQFNVTVTTIDNRVIDIEPGNTTSKCCGIAFDIGTTTIVGTLVDLISGADIAVASQINPQTSFGDDVVSRIKLCRDEESGLARLQEAVLQAVNAIINKVLRESGVDRKSVYEAVFAGNTTMQEVLCGINPLSLGELPFVPVFREPLRMRAWDLNVKINPHGDVHIFPQIGGFVGGDTVAGIIATRLDQMKEPALLVDVGTNGEIVLSNKGKLVATSVAAGPAFEGARIVNGMRGTHGAIEKVVADGDILVNVIGNAKPAGICGSGLIDATAELLRMGVLDSTGRILGPDELPRDVPDAIRKRLIKNHDQYDVLLVDRTRTATGEPLCLYQKDIRELQLATGAIRAGISILLKHEGLQPDDLGSVLLAGAFGNFIRRKNARRIGMLPQIPCERIRFMGNTASFGAKMVLLSRAEEEYAARVTRETRHLDLSLDPEFQMEFSSAMLFPEQDVEAPLADPACHEQ